MPASDALHRRDGFAQAHDRRAEHLLARKREQLPRDGRAAIGRALHLGRHLVEAGAILQLLEQQLRVPRHDGHQVVDVVRDPSGQTADRFHLQGLPKLHFRATERFRSPWIDVEIGHRGVAGGSNGHALGAYTPRKQS